ncbi:MAG: Bcr/CflA family multidrug efflux MFS transporter [Proteobacteria bacterium]|nr:Bcr/CflA family multidrug efflux MFS transporter [Pseudomonadota bacterium]MDA1058049.1 Bcr/CflA family multidrug efflux MFS transporter [Pseudomonadota bacterium]
MNSKIPGGITLLLILAAFSASAPMSVDMYLPSLPELARDLGTSSGQVQLTLSAFLLGFAFAPIVWGPLSDRYGRKPILYIGLTIFVGASVGAALSPSIDVLIGFRFLQALGGSAASALSRAIVRDRYGREDAARTLSLLFMVMSVAPMVAPILGGQVLVFFGWRAIFWALAGFGVICLMIAVYPLRETLAPDRRTTHHVGEMAKSYGALLRNRRFFGYALCQSLSFAAMFAYIAGSPFVLIELLGVAPELYGFLFAAHVVALMAGSFINSRLVTRLGVDRMLLIGTVGLASGGVLVLIAGATAAPLTVLLMAVVFMMLFVTMIGANATAGALSEFSHMAGTASGFLGMTQFAIGAGAGALVALFHDGTAVPLTAVMMAGGILALAVRLTILRGSAAAVEAD